MQAAATGPLELKHAQARTYAGFTRTNLQSWEISCVDSLSGGEQPPFSLLKLPHWTCAHTHFTYVMPMRGLPPPPRVWRHMEEARYEVGTADGPSRLSVHLPTRGRARASVGCVYAGSC